MTRPLFKHFYIILSEAHFNSKSQKLITRIFDMSRQPTREPNASGSHYNWMQWIRVTGGTATPVNAWPLTHRGVLYTGVVTFVDLFILESRCCRRDDPRECQDRVTEGHFLFTSCDMAHVPLSQENEKLSRHCWQFSSRSHFCVLCKVLHCENNQVELV